MGLTNNDIFKKLRVAHKLRDTDIVEICALVDFKVSKSELGAFFLEMKNIQNIWIVEIKFYVIF
jgi:uncharacterized protein YehS (DUF1456 family)